MSAEPALVSVLIPAFNAEKFISETLACVANQTYRHLDIIVVDDGSSDRTAAIVDAFSRSDARFRYYPQPNRGVAAARNQALAMAQEAAPFPPPPEILGASVQVDVRVEFHLQ